METSRSAGSAMTQMFPGKKIIRELGKEKVFSVKMRADRFPMGA